jgi:hypothetical protein
MRIFEPILGEKASSLRVFYINAIIAIQSNNLFAIVSGDHTRTIQIATPTVGGLMKFAIKTITCLGCKTPLRGKESGKLISPSGQCYSFIVYIKPVLYVRIADRGCRNCIKDR